MDKKQRPEFTPDGKKIFYIPVEKITDDKETQKRLLKDQADWKKRNQK